MIRLALALTLLLPLPGLAQSVVGKAIVDGRPVTLYDDNTWSFATPAVPGCTELSAKLRFCGDSTRWRPSALPTPDAIAAYRHDDTHYAQIIIEDIGTAQGFTVDAVTDYILDFAARSSGTPATVITTDPASHGGLDGRTVVYAFQVSGIDTVYANTILVGENTLLQIITYQIGPEYTPFHADLHAEFLTATEVAE